MVFISVNTPTKKKELKKSLELGTGLRPKNSSKNSGRHTIVVRKVPYL